MTAEDARKIIVLMARATLQGSEAPEFMRLVGLLEAIAQTPAKEP